MSEFPNASLIDPSSLFGLRHIGDFIERTQLPSGAIPSNLDSSHDPWDHLEAVMGLSTLGLNILVTIPKVIAKINTPAI